MLSDVIDVVLSFLCSVSCLACMRVCVCACVHVCLWDSPPKVAGSSRERVDEDRDAPVTKGQVEQQQVVRLAPHLLVAKNDVDDESISKKSQHVWKNKSKHNRSKIRKIE